MRADGRVATRYINCSAPFRLATLGTFPILRPIFHIMKNAGRVILEECKGQARKLDEQLIYRSENIKILGNECLE